MVSVYVNLHIYVAGGGGGGGGADHEDPMSAMGSVVGHTRRIVLHAPRVIGREL